MSTHTNRSARNISLAVITGGSRGLGKSMALHLADHGVGSVITYRSSAREADEVVSAIRAKGQKAAALQLDAADSKSFSAFAESLKGTLKQVFDRDSFDALVNNAGHGLHRLIAETSEPELDEIINVHFKAPFLLTQKLLPLIKNGGRILNVSSGLARFSMPGYAAYASMKGAVEVLTRYMAKELGDRKISVNTLAPGAIATDFNGGAVRDNAMVNKMVASITALGRVGEADDIGGAVAMLLADESGWINGQRIEVSGGMNL